jgi:hypothetical protein
VLENRHERAVRGGQVSRYSADRRPIDVIAISASSGWSAIVPFTPRALRILKVNQVVAGVSYDRDVHPLCSVRPMPALDGQPARAARRR